MNERPLKIAFIAHGFPPRVGGTELYNVEYARRLHEQGHRVNVFTCGGHTPGETEADAMLPMEVHREPLVERRKEIVPQGIDRAKAGEGFGISYAEAGACGKPVVASASGGGSEIVADGVTGRVVEPRDQAMLEAALTDLLANPGKARELGAKARQRVRRYDRSEGLRELERVLRWASSRSR